MTDYPAYHATVAEVPEYVEQVIRLSRTYEVAYDDALAAAQKSLDYYHTGPFGDMTRDPYIVFIEHAVADLDPFKSTPLVMSAHTNLYRVALKYWARQGGYPVSKVWAWFDAKVAKYGDLNHVPYSDKIWDEFANLFPITLPRDADGKVDATKLDQMTDFQRALITAQSAEVAETCALGGGDDTWFDYLPNGILTLAALQDEGWAPTWAEYINGMEKAKAKALAENDDEDELYEAEEELSDKLGFFIQDTTTPLLTMFL